MSNDRIDEKAANARLPKPEVHILVNGETVVKPGMKTYFVDTTLQDKNKAGQYKGSDGEVVGGVVCTCNKVCTCNSQRTTTRCSCNSHRTSGGCSCYPVH